MKKRTSIFKPLEDVMKKENEHLRYRLMQAELQIHRLHGELLEAERELEMLRPMGIVWRPEKKDDSIKVPF